MPQPTPKSPPVTPNPNPKYKPKRGCCRHCGKGELSIRVVNLFFMGFNVSRALLLAWETKLTFFSSEAASTGFSPATGADLESIGSTLGGCSEFSNLLARL